MYKSKLSKIHSKRNKKGILASDDGGPILYDGSYTLPNLNKFISSDLILIVNDIYNKLIRVVFPHICIWISVWFFLASFNIKFYYSVSDLSIDCIFKI